MSPKRIEQPVTSHAELPWWLRILENQGFTTLFACVVLFGGWRLFEAHMDYLRLQTRQMDQQTQILREIANSSMRQEETLEKLKRSIQPQN